jgi:hypothetical protein
VAFGASVIIVHHQDANKDSLCMFHKKALYNAFVHELRNRAPRLIDIGKALAARTCTVLKSFSILQQRKTKSIYSNLGTFGGRKKR